MTQVLFLQHHDPKMPVKMRYINQVVGVVWCYSRIPALRSRGREIQKFKVL